MKRPILTLSCLSILAAITAEAAIYQIKNADGTVTYTDQPVAGATPFNLSGVNAVEVPALATPTQKPLKTEKPPAPQVQVSIVSPAPEATMRDNQGNVVIKAQRSDANAKGQYELYLDGKLHTRSAGPVFQLTNLDRGAHQFSIRLLDNKGKTLASTPTQTFYLHRASALITPN